FRRVSHPGVSPWRRLVAPGLAALALFAIGTVTVTNARAVLGTARGSAFIYVLPGVVAVAAIGGLAWGLVLRATRPEIYAMIGQGIGGQGIGSGIGTLSDAEVSIASPTELIDQPAAAAVRGSVGSHHTAPVVRSVPPRASATRLPPAGRRA